MGVKLQAATLRRSSYLGVPDVISPLLSGCAPPGCARFCAGGQRTHGSLVPVSARACRVFLLGPSLLNYRQELIDFCEKLARAEWFGDVTIATCLPGLLLIFGKRV